MLVFAQTVTILRRMDAEKFDDEEILSDCTLHRSLVDFLPSKTPLYRSTGVYIHGKYVGNLMGLDLTGDWKKPL